MARKLSAAHLNAVTEFNRIKRENLAYHFILAAKVDARLLLVGRVEDYGDLYTWQITYTPRMIDAVILETFRSSNGQEPSYRVFYLDDVRSQYRSLTGSSLADKMRGLYYMAKGMEERAQDAVSLVMAREAERDSEAHAAS